MRTSASFSPKTIPDEQVERLLALLFAEDEPTTPVVAE